MKRKISLLVPFVLAFIATILFLIDVALDSSRLILAVIGAILTIFWVAYAFVLKKLSQDGKTALETILQRYDGKLSQTEWTQVYLKPGAIHKLGIYSADIESDTDRFYAKIQPNTSTSLWNDRQPHILVAIVKEKEWISDSTPIIKYDLKGFEELFSSEKS